METSKQKVAVEVRCFRCFNRNNMRALYLIVSICIATFLCGCSDPTQRISESNLNDVFTSVEQLEDKVDNLIVKGSANKEELLDLQEDIQRLHSDLEDSFYDDGYYEP